MVKFKIWIYFKKILVFFISFAILSSQTFFGYQYSYADGISDYNPALIPIFTLVSTVMIGSGIVARNATDSLNQLTSNVINNIKNTEVARSEADPTYNSPYRVVNGGRSEKPNNNNKNGKWFGLGVASALGSAVAFEKGATEDIMRTVNDLNGYKSMVGSVGIISADSFKTKGTASSVALDLANISSSSLTQFNEFLQSDWWGQNELDKNNCLFFVNTNISDIIREQPRYPETCIHIIEKSDDLKFLDVVGNVFGYYTYSNNYGEKTYYFVSTRSKVINFLNNDHVSLSLRTAKIYIPARSANSTFTYNVAKNLNLSNNLSIDHFNSIGNTETSNQSRYAASGYKWQSENPWSFTNNVYNVNQNFNVNFPDWVQESFNLLGQNVEGIRLGIDSLNEYWQNTQSNVQIGESPDNVISQLLNNYLNPETAPDPEPDPDPDPDPEPDPEPLPEPIPDNTYLGEFLLPDTITTKFPFCIPFDIARCLRLFSTNSRQAPRWESDLYYGSNTYHVVIDLSPFDGVASLIRPIEFIAFLVGLAFATRYLIKG